MRQLPVWALLVCAAVPAAAREPEKEARTVPVATIPHIALGGGWRTSIRIPNPTRVFHEVRLETYRPDGAPMQAVMNGRPAFSQTYPVPPLGVLELDLDKEGSGEDGYAALLFLTGAPLPHTVVYLLHGEAQGSVGKSAGGQYASDYFQFDNTDGGVTGLAFLVPLSTGDAHHRITCYTASGAILGAYSFPLAGSRTLQPGGYRKYLLAAPENLSSTENLSGACFFSVSTAGVPVEKPVARLVVSLRLLKSSFHPLTY